MYFKFTESRSKAFSSHAQRKSDCEAMDVLINPIVVIISQCIHVSNQHIVHLKYIEFYLPTLSQ